MSSVEKRREALTHKTFILSLSVLGIFGVPAIIGFFVGRWVDVSYGVRPYGSMAVLAVTFLFSWVLIIRLYLKLTKEFAKIREDEEKERAEVQKT